ncbi:MAG: hypothetical protein AB1Z98_40405 [Nannocystaceae bacterium]
MRPNAVPSATLELSLLLQTTARDEVLPLVAERIERGLEPAELIEATYLAATRSISTREHFDAPQHALLMMPSIMRASEVVDARDRWRPLLWWVDFYKWGQHELSEAEARPMRSADELPPVPAERAAVALREAIEALDGARAERAVVSLHRSRPPEEVARALLLLGSRDLRQIGHKAIHVASGCRFLEAVGWHHAESVFRSIALTLALPDDDEAETDRDFDSAWVDNERRLVGVTDWGPDGAGHDEATLAVLAAIRSASPSDACELATEWARRGASAQSLWDAAYLGAVELMFNNPTGIVALHPVTASNAAGSAHARCRGPQPRGLLLLQNIARVTDLHRVVDGYAEDEDGPPKESPVHVETLEPLGGASEHDPVEAIFDGVGGTAAERLRAAQATLAYLGGGRPAIERLRSRATELVMQTANDTHDFKVCSIAFEDYRRISERWRGHYLAACSARFRGTREPPAKLGVIGSD